MRWMIGIFAVLLGLVALIAVIGALLPVGHVASQSRTFSPPIERVFATVADVRGYPRWRPGVSQATVLSEEPLRWREDGSNGKIEFELSVNEPPRRQVVLITSKDLPFGGRWEYDFAPEGAGTRLTLTEHGEVYNPIFRFMARFVFGHEKTMADYLAALDKYLANGAAP